MINELPDFQAVKKRFEALPNGARAEIRRAALPEDMAWLSGFYRLFPGERPDERHRRLAFLLPHAKNDPNPKAQSLGSQCSKRISENRVLQIARSDSPLDIVQLRRLLIHIDPALNWSEFGRMIWFWNDKSKRKLVEDFYIAQLDPS
ncbi:MAG TPA: type I-E CRISPR-associated protein Cse2/CasB, partial [Deltaproteobacteria bacterium]|nr:type I-E CRISPR-associated protein Cse2/CasB [Deltaproteobacteria bacterium]